MCALISLSSVGSDPQHVVDRAGQVTARDEAGRGDPASAPLSRPVTKATIAGAMIGFCIAVISAILLFVEFASWISSWGIVVRKMLGFP